MKKTFLFECVLCAILLFAGITIAFRENSKATEAGAFGNILLSNDTFEDLSRNLLGELFG